MIAIKLTKAKADSVRGNYLHNHRLEPIKIDSYYYLPASVLEIAAYAETLDILNDCPIVYIEPDVEDEETE